MKVQKEKIIDISIPVAIALFIIGIGVVTFRYNRDKSEYEEYVKEFNVLAQELINDNININNLSDDLTKYEDNLYRSMTSYYEDSNDEILRYVFEKRFPTLDNYNNDKRQAFIVISALLQLYPEMKSDPDISSDLIGIKNTNESIYQYTNDYNSKVDNYNELGDKINDSDYVNVWNPEAMVSCTIKKAVYSVDSYYTYSEVNYTNETSDPVTFK